MRQVPSGASGLRGLNFLMRLLDPEIPRNVRDQVLDRAEMSCIGSTVTGCIERQCAQPRHAHQLRHAVDFGRARAALAGLAIPAHRQIVGLFGLDLMHGVEHHHACPRLRCCNRWNLPPAFVAAPDSKRCVRHVTSSPRSSVSILPASAAAGSRVDLASLHPRPCRTTMLNCPVLRVFAPG